MLKWAREGLKLGLRAAIHAAQKEDHPISRDGIQVSGTNRTVRITVVPLKGASAIHSSLVLFEEAPPSTLETIAPTTLSSQSGKQGKRSTAAKRVANLEQS